MSIAANQAFLNMYTARRLDSQYGVQQANQSLMNMMANPTACTPLETLKAERQIMFGSLRDQLIAKCCEAAEESLKKQQKKNIEKSFDTFA